MRMLLVALICLALARPRAGGDRATPLDGDRPTAAVLVFDTSFSMGYAVARAVGGGKTEMSTRLEEARRRALELLGQLSEGSRVAILDSAGTGGQGFEAPSAAMERLADLQLRPANAPVSRQLGHAYELLARASQDPERPEDALRPMLCVFSDRTQASWDASAADGLRQLRQRVPGVQAAFFDLGVDEPMDLAVLDIDLPRQSVPTGDRAIMRATLRATGRGGENEVVCRIDAGQQPEDRKPVRLEPGESQTVIFERRDLAPGFHQAEIFLQAADQTLPFNNTRFVTFAVRGPRRVLTITDAANYGPFRGGNAVLWKTALESHSELGGFACDVKTTAETANLFPDALRARYEAVVLLDVAAPSAELWDRLLAYVRLGGGLGIVPGGSELSLDAYGAKAARELLPGRLLRIVRTGGDGVEWDWKLADYQHPLSAPFREWRLEGSVDFFRHPRSAASYWEVRQEGPGSSVLLRYDDPPRRPAILERVLSGAPGTRRRVLLFTTTMDGRRWNNYAETVTALFPTLAQLTAAYLTGAAQDGHFNHLSGQPVSVALPPGSRFPTYTVIGPGLIGADALVPRAENEGGLLLSKAVLPGNYQVVGPDGSPAGRFSVNVPPEESDLGRIPVEQVEAVLGSGSLVPLDPKVSLLEAVQKRRGHPLPPSLWLVVGLLALFAIETLAANCFYRRESPAAEAPEGVAA